MAGNQRNPNIGGPNGAHRSNAPLVPAGPSGRPVDPQPPPVQPLPGPSRAGLPVDLARGPSVEISDVSRDLKTTNDMREDLTEYAIFRFEKMPTQNQYDDEGRLQLPTWDRAIRTRVPGMSPREIVREIQHLNRNTRNLTDKLKSLSPVLQRQIDKAQEDLTLQNSDPVNYHWVLAQLDHQLREIVPYIVVAGGSHPTSRRRYGSTRRRSDGRASRRERKSYERISLRAYFKRTPRPNVDITMLWEAKNLRNNQIVRPQSHPHQHPHQQPQVHQQQQPPLRPQPNPSLDLRAQQPGVLPSGSGATRGPPPVAPYSNKPSTGNAFNPANNATASGRDVGRGRVKESNRNRDKHSDVESDSDYTDYISMDGSVDIHMTPDTSQPGSPYDGMRRARGRGEGRMPTRSRSRRHDSNIHDRHSPRRQQYSNIKAGPRVQPGITPGPRPPPPAKDIEDAYFAGMRRGRDGARISQERAYRQGKRAHHRPYIVPGTRLSTPPHRRHISNSDPEGFRHQGDLDDEIDRFNRLSLDEEDDYGTILHREDVRRRREFEYLLHQGSVLDDDPFDRDRPSYSRHGNRQYREPYVTDGSESDLSLPERGKRWLHC
ncbi:hypothetical protein F4805DRAFT_83369 [Annulohypoxylon moriforme]|nr:hypothetical protein F4805DRAFT_83369 [Annulohypoxylon moriforme]